MKVVKRAATGLQSRAASRLLLLSSTCATPPRLLIGAFALRVSAAAMAVVMTLSPVLSFAQSVPVGVNNIVPDGRTATTVTTNGATSTVTTNTISGPNAFNSFSQFQIGRGATGNLILPNGTNNLINLLNSNDPAVINGVLNGYKNGQIGGNIYFAAPGGFVVGSSGTVNVGSLNVTTPTREFVDGVINHAGQINQGAVDNLLAGTVPLSPDGNIRIRGRVNAIDAVRLTGQNVVVGTRDAINRDHAAKFASTVNSKGLQSASRIVVRNGSIQIVAGTDAHINGRLTARKGSVSVTAGRDATFGNKANVSVASKNGNGGSIAVNAARDIKVAGYGVLSAKSTNGNAGTVRLIAGRNLDVTPGATFDASSAQGDGGLVELSAMDHVNLPAGIKVKVGAPNGQAGYLLIDPMEMTIVADAVGGTNGYTSTEVQGWVDSVDAGGTLILCAGSGGGNCNGTFTLAAGGVIDARRTAGGVVNVSIAANEIDIYGTIDTRSYTGARVDDLLSSAGRLSTGNSMSVALNAPTIVIGSTGKILADVNNATGTNATSYTAGDITMTATARDIQAQAPSSATTSISIGGRLTGKAVTAIANSEASTVFLNSGVGMAQFVAGAFGGILTGLAGGYVKSEASAKVTVEGTANITATGAVTLQAIGSETAQDPAINFSLAALQNAVAASVVVGVVNADIAAQIKSGARISSGDLIVIASNDADLSVKSLIFTSTTAYDGTFAYSTGTVNTRATIDPGVIIDKVGNVTVAAQNTNSFSTSATSFSAGVGRAAVAVAISDVTNNAVANLGASLPSAAGAGNVTVYSGSNTTANSVGASSTVGTNFLVDGVFSALGTLSTSVASLFAPGGPFDQTQLFTTTATQGTTATMRAGITLALNFADLSSSASIAALAPDAGGHMVASGVAPTVVASGDVAVISSLTDAGLRGNAETSITAGGLTNANPQTGSAVSMAVNVVQVTQSSNAFIGSGVSISGSHIGVSADASTPITITWLDFDSFSAVTSHISGNFGVVSNILTSYANATSDSTTTGIAGAVNYFEVTTNTTAWVGSGATLTQTGTSSCVGVSGTCWTTTLPASLDGAPSPINWTSDIQVAAATTTESINVGGNFSWLKLFGTNSTSTEGSAVGGSANVNIFNTSTVAGIGAGASVTTIGNLAVTATTSDLIYAVAPTSGKGSGLGLNGIASVLEIDNTTSASISNLARISADSVAVNAEQHISSFDVAGGVGSSTATGVGLVVALVSTSLDTKAFIGDNSNELAATGATADDSHATPSVTAGISAFDLSVTALNVGRLTTVSVAAQSANNIPDPAATPPFLKTAPDGPGYLAAAAAFFTDVGIGLLLKVTTVYNNLTNDVSGPVNGGNVVAGAGSASVDLTSVSTAAWIAGATIGYTPGGNNHVTVRALNNTIIDTASGSAALAKAAPGSNYAVALAGAVAVTVSNDMTTARIWQSNISAYETTVQALAGGESTTIGLAVAVTGGTANSSLQTAASVSIAQITSGVQANIDSSTIMSAVGYSAGNIGIYADRKVNIGIGAGSLYGGFTATPDPNSTNAGVGVAMTYAEIGDPSNGAAVSAVLSNSKVDRTNTLNIQAIDQSRIASGAATVGGGANSSGFAGSVVVNDINPTILAEITGIAADSSRATVTGGITVIGDIIVNSSGGSIAALDALIANAALSANGGLAVASDSNVDFTGGAVSPSSATGAAIIAVAGHVQLGKSNVGVSIVVNRIGTRHLALIDRATVTSTGGVVSVSAVDDAEIIGIAIGVGAATGSIAGNGSVAYNAINNAVVAQIGHGIDEDDAEGAATAVVDAAAVSVKAQDSATIRGAAGAISLNFGGGNAVGLSAAIDQIGTFVSAGIVGATVTADNTLGNSTLIGGNLQAGTVLVSGSSTATITTVSIGAAMSVGNPAPQASPQANLSSLVSALRLATPSALTGFGGGGITPPTPPQPPAASSTPSNGLAGAGSLALSTESTTVYSTIDQGGNNRGASVTANNNVLVLASNTDSIDVYAGAGSIAIDSGKGVGASVVVNTINGTTSAGIANATVDARASGTAATIDSGVLADDIDPSAVVTPGQSPSLANGTTTVKGVAVIGTSQQKATTVALVFAASTSGLAISANAVTNLMGGTTEAQITSSSINTNLSAGQVSAVQVTASSASFANILDLGMSDSASGAAGTAALVINTMDRTTTANIDSTNIGSSSIAAGAVGVLANAFQGSAAEVVGASGSGSSAAVTGTALTNLFQSETTATLDHGTVYASRLDVIANGANGFFGAVGAGSLASSAAIGATVLVAMMENTVTARVGDRDASTAATTLNLGGPLNVLASNDTDINSYTVAGAVGGSAGIATQFSGLFIANNVNAELDNTSTTITTPTNGGVTVSAIETDSLAPVVGALSGGGSVGIGAAVNLVMLKSSTAALVAGGSINAAGAVVTVSALSTRDVNPVTVVLSLAGSVGIAGTVGVVIVGSGASTEQMSVLNSGADDNDANSGTLGNAGAATGTDLLGTLAGGVDGISAQILSSNVTAGAIGVGATARTAVRNISGAAALGTGVTGQGAAVAITEVDQQVTAKTNGGTLTAPTIAVTASAGDHGSGHTAESIGASGAGGYYLGVGAAVGKSRVDNTVIAELGSRTDGGATGSTSGSLAVSASDTSTLAASGYGLGVGLAAVGLSLAFTEKASAITADIAASTTVTNFDGVMVIANAAGGLNSYTLAGAGGSISGAGATSTANDAETVIAKIGAGSSITADDAGVLVSATATPNVSTSAIGVAVGNISIGASVAESTVTTHVTASVDDNATIAGGPLTIAAAALVPTSGHSANAFAVGSGGGMMLGLQASYAQAANSSYVTAYGGKNLHLPTANVTIAAENDTNQLAAATGVSAAYYAAGATVAETSSFTRTNAYLDTGAVMTDSSNHGVLAITATGSDSNTANATAGSGGFVAGAAAIASTSADNTTVAELRGDANASSRDTLYFGGLGINAQHSATYAANGDAYQASAVGASGGSATNDVLSNVTANVGPNLEVNSAGGNMNVISADSVNQTSGGSRAGSGGILAGAATLSQATVTQNVTSNIGSNTILSLNDDPSTSTALINIEAYNFLDTTDTVNMTVGSIFAGGGAYSNMNATATNAVNIADNAHLFSAGNIAIGTAAVMTARNNANGSFYGLVSGGSVTTDSVLNAYQTVTVGRAVIEGWGLINIYAGQSGDGSYTTAIKANGTTTVYNNTVSSIISDTVPHWGAATANSYTTLTLGTGSQVLGANNVSLGATSGQTAANGQGSLYSPFLEIFSSVARDNRGRTPITSGDVILNGLVAAGIHNQQIITIDYDGNVSYSSGGSPCDLATVNCDISLVQVSGTNQFNPIMSWNNQTIQYAVLAGFNPKQDVINQIANLSGLTAAQVSAAVAANQTITAQNDDADGTKQRQIDTYIQQLPYMTDQNGSAYAFSNILASAGNVSILASRITGNIVNGVTPSVVARDSALISIDNQGTNFLFTSALTISGVTGGRINFLGAAQDRDIQADATHGVTLTRDLANLSPTITLASSWSAMNDSRQPVDRAGHVLVTTPDIYLGGLVTNVNGVLSVTNALGNVLITRDIRAGTVVMNVPEGLIGGNLGANSVYNSNFDVASQWSGVEYRPTDVLTAVYAAATYLGIYGAGDGAIAIGGQWDKHPYYWYGNNVGDHNPTQENVYVNCARTGCDPSTVFTARMLAAYYDSQSLYSWIFLPVGEGVTPSAGGTAASWVRNQYNGQAYSGDSGPFNYATGGNFFQVIQIQNQVVNGVQADAANNTSTSTIRAGKALILSAAAININGTIEVGQSSNYSVNIGDQAKALIQDIKDHADRLAAAQRDAAAGRYVDLTDYVTTVNGSDVKVTASYNALTDQIVLSPVVQGTGGYVYLNGKILSTSTSGQSQGNIVVHGGAGTVTVNNTTDTALVTNVINTGVSAASVVEIVDRAKNQTTWYVYNAGAPANQQVTTYTTNSVSASSYANLTGTTSANANLWYQPADQLYQWTDTASLSRASTSDMTVFGWNFDNIASANSSVYPYVRSAPQVVYGTQSSNFQETVSATGSYTQYVTGTGDRCCGTDFRGDWYRERFEHLTLTMTNSVKANYAIGVSFTGGGTSNISINSNATVVINDSINNLQGATTINTTGANSAIVAGASAFVSGTSVALNGEGGVGSSTNPIPIATFGGTFSATSIDRDIAVTATGGLNVVQVKANPRNGGSSQGNVYIAATGDITSVSPYNPASPIIVGKSIEIDSSGGAIGARSGVDSQGHAILTDINPIVIQAQATLLSNGTYDGGLLNSFSENGTYIIQSSGDLRIGEVSSHGAVLLAAWGADGRTASILNGTKSDGMTAEQNAYLQSVWQNLNLQGDGSGVPASVTAYQQMINAAYNEYWQLQNIINTDGSISALGAQMIATQLAAKLNKTVAEITTDQIQAEVTLRLAKDKYLLGITAAEVAANLHIDVSQVTAAQVAAALPLSSDGTRMTLDQLFGTTSGTTSQFQWAVATTQLTDALTPTGYSSSFRYTLPTTSALYASLATGSQWSLDQLTYTVSPGANPENGIPAPALDASQPNVSGRQVMLYARNGNIGSLATPATFTFRSDDASNLTDAQKTLLASAGPGQLTVTTTDVPGTNGQVKQYTVSIAQQSLLVVDPLGPVSANAQSQVYLGSASDLKLGGIPLSAYGPVTQAYSAGVYTAQPGEVVLHAVGSILGGVASQVAISGNVARLTLIADHGSIGQAGDPTDNPNALWLALSNPNGMVDQADAAKGIYLRQTTGDLILGNINAGSGTDGVLQLSASGDIYAESQFTDRSAVHIVATTFDVRAGGDIGFNGTSFQPLQVKISGAITGAAGGKISLLSPTSSMTIGVLSALGALTLDTDVGNITINGNVGAGGLLTLIANGGITIAAGTADAPTTVSSGANGVTIVSATLSMGSYTDINAAGLISVTTTGGAIVGRLTSSLAFVGTGGDAIVVTAGGVTDANIFSNGDGRANFVATGAGARLSLTASNSIGTVSQRVTVSAQALAATATNGSIYLVASPGMHATLLSAVKGTVDVTGAGSYTLDSVLASTDADATGHFIAQTTGPGTLTVGTATGRGTLQLLAADSVSFGSLTSLALAGDPADVIVTTATGAILGGSITAAGGVTLTAGATLAADSPLVADAKITGTGTITSSTLIALNARGDIDWETLNAATTIAVASTDGGARVGTATTVGTITMQGKQDVAFDQLTNTAAPGQGDVTLTSYSGSIVGGSITSNGSVSLIAEGSITATGAAGDGGELNWSVLRAGGSMFVRSLGAAVTVDVVESGGSLTLWAKYDVTFRQVKTTGANSDIVLRSDEGAIIALGTGLVNVDASGSVTMNAATTITGAEVRAGGSVEMTAANGQIRWNAVTAGTTVDVRSSANVIDIATITSGGAQTLWAKNDVTFTQLTATAGGADITSDTGAIVGGAVSLAGATHMAAKTTISGTTATSTAGAMDMTAEGMITWNAVEATGGSLTITSTRETIDIPSLTSGGKMTIDVAQDMAITEITTTGITNDAGDVEVTSHTGRITGGTIAANGGVTLTAPVSITGVSATGATGAIAMNTDGLIDWTTLSAGTTIGLRSTADAVNIGTATSGGTQSIRAAQDVTFTTLTTTGITGDDGDIGVTSDTGAIAGTTVAANGSARLAAAASSTGTAITATRGLINLTAGGLVDWTTLSAGTTTNVLSSNDAVNLGTARSGGALSILAARDVTFDELTTTGTDHDAGDVSVTSNLGAVQGTTVAANGSATVIAALTNKGTDITAANGSVSLVAGGLIDWSSLSAGTSIDVRSSGDAVNFGTATSGGSQTIRAARNVTFDQITTSGITGDVGDVSVTADAGLIQGTTVGANGSATLNAATTNKGTMLTASTGSINLSGAGLIDWATLNAGTAINVRSTTESVNLGTATSGGTQTIRAARNVTFGQLAASGITGDVGSIFVTADAGAIHGTTVTAHGSATVTAATDNIGNALTAATGDAILRAGSLLQWNTITAGKTVVAESAGSSIQLGTVASGGSQSLRAWNDIVFNRLTTAGTAADLGDVTLQAVNGQVRGAELLANGNVDIAASTHVALGTVQGNAASLRTPQDITVAQLNVYRSITLQADTMNVVAKQLPSLPPVPLYVTVSGFNGGVATFANLNIDPPQVIVDQYHVVDSVLVVDSPNLTIMDGYVPGRLALSTPAGDILLNNRTPAPTSGVNLQLYQADGVFSMQQIGNANYSNTYVVWYDTVVASHITRNVTDTTGGTSFVRDSLQDMRNNGAFDPLYTEKSGLATLYLLGPQGLGLRDRIVLPVEVLGDGPAVNLDGMFERKRPASKRNRANSRSTELGKSSGVRVASGSR